jgi:hypothetical protein
VRQGVVFRRLSLKIAASPAAQVPYLFMLLFGLCLGMSVEQSYIIYGGGRAYVVSCTLLQVYAVCICAVCICSVCFVLCAVCICTASQVLQPLLTVVSRHSVRMVHASQAKKLQNNTALLKYILCRTSACFMPFVGTLFSPMI